MQVVTTKQSSKFSNEVTATTTFTKTELEKFKESLNLDNMDAEINNLKSNVQKKGI